MKPFNLEKAKAGKSVCTRNGYHVEILRFDVKDKNYPLCGIMGVDGREHVGTWTIAGKYSAEDEPASKYDLDLVMAPKQIWCDLYESTIDIKNGVPYRFLDTKIFSSKEEAESAATQLPKSRLVKTFSFELDED